MSALVSRDNQIQFRLFKNCEIAPNAYTQWEAQKQMLTLVLIAIRNRDYRSFKLCHCSNVSFYF